MNNFKVTEFNNGFKYLTIKNKTIAHCVIFIVLGSGSVFESKELSGISHYLEHMPFKGSKKYNNTKLVLGLTSTLLGWIFLWIIVQTGFSKCENLCIIN